MLSTATKWVMPSRSTGRCRANRRGGPPAPPSGPYEPCPVSASARAPLPRFGAAGARASWSACAAAGRSVRHALGGRAIRHQGQQEDARHQEGDDGDHDGEEVGRQRRRADRRLARPRAGSGPPSRCSACRRSATPSALAESRSGGRPPRAAGQPERQPRRRDGDDHARDHERGRVVEVRARVQRRHADVVHRGDAAAHGGGGGGKPRRRSAARRSPRTPRRRPRSRRPGTTAASGNTR